MAIVARAPQVGEQVVDGQGRVMADFAVLLQQLARALATEQETGTDLTTEVNNLALDVASINSDITTIEASITTIEGDVSTAEAAILALQTAEVKATSYTVAGVPSAATEGAGTIVYVSDEAGGAVLAFSDGTNWRRVTDRAVIS